MKLKRQFELCGFLYWGFLLFLWNCLEFYYTTVRFFGVCIDKTLHLVQQLVIYETSASELDIIRDISRTFPSHVFFQQRHGPGQRSLYNVLKAYSVFDRDVGYVQVLIRNSSPFCACCEVSHNIYHFKTPGNGVFSGAFASLYEWGGCILVVGGIVERSCSCPNGRLVSGNRFVPCIYLFGLLMVSVYYPCLI